MFEGGKGVARGLMAIPLANFTGSSCVNVVYASLL